MLVSGLASRYVFKSERADLGVEGEEAETVSGEKMRETGDALGLSVWASSSRGYSRMAWALVPPNPIVLHQQFNSTTLACFLLPVDASPVDSPKLLTLTRRGWPGSVVGQGFAV